MPRQYVTREIACVDGLSPVQIGIDTLKVIASHQDLMQRLIDLTGFEAATLRAAARSGFSVDVLDFILRLEPDVLDLASRLAPPPAAIRQARDALAKRGHESERC